MFMKQHFLMFAAYNRWANGRIYDAVSGLSAAEFEQNVGAFFKSAMGTLNHILVADRIWMARFTGGGTAPKSLDMILFRDFGKLQIARAAEDKLIIEWVGSLSEADLAGRFTYISVVDLRTVSQRLAPALAHVFNHQTHHRGQVHTILTALGRSSVEIDLSYFQRSEEGRAFA